MLFALGFLAELLTLFLLSKILINLLFAFFYKISRSKKFSIYFLSLIFFPGTLIHELSHYLVAILLQVPIGAMHLFPKETETGIKLGSVEIAKTDPFRRMLIGLGPFIFGSFLLVGIFFYGATNSLFDNSLFIAIAGYLVFEIGNTMFSSKKDLEGAIETCLAITVLLIIFYILGFRLPALNPNLIFSNTLVEQIFQKAVIYMLPALGIDIVLILILLL